MWIQGKLQVLIHCKAGTTYLVYSLISILLFLYVRLVYILHHRQYCINLADYTPSQMQSSLLLSIRECWTLCTLLFSGTDLFHAKDVNVTWWEMLWIDDFPVSDTKHFPVRSQVQLLWRWKQRRCLEWSEIYSSNLFCKVDKTSLSHSSARKSWKCAVQVFRGMILTLHIPWQLTGSTAVQR